MPDDKKPHARDEMAALWREATMAPLIKMLETELGPLADAITEAGKGLARRLAAVRAAYDLAAEETRADSARVAPRRPAQPAPEPAAPPTSRPIDPETARAQVRETLRSARKP